MSPGPTGYPTTCLSSRFDDLCECNEENFRRCFSIDSYGSFMALKTTSAQGPPARAGWFPLEIHSLSSCLVVSQSGYLCYSLEEFCGYTVTINSAVVPQTLRASPGL